MSGKPALYVVRLRRPGAKWGTAKTAPNWQECAGKFSSEKGAKDAAYRLNGGKGDTTYSPASISSLPPSMEVQKMNLETEIQQRLAAEKTAFQDAAEVEAETPIQTGTNLHPCYAIGCATSLPKHLLMCRHHWSMVPPALQQAVWRYYNARKKSPEDMGLKAQWAMACSRARQWVAAEEGKDNA